MRKTFQEYKSLRENSEESSGESVSKDWRKGFIQLEKGFIPPTKMRPIIEAFLKSGEIELSHDTGKSPTMPKKSLFLVGGPVRDFLAGRSIKDFDLATNATPAQIAQILTNGGFKMSDDRSGQAGEELKLTFDPPKAQSGDKRTWYVKGRDASEAKKVFVIGAVVEGEDFDIATFRKDAKVTDGAAEVDFVDNPHADASRRDLTINALYIELTKPDGENTKLYDPTGKGFHDVKNNKVRTVGKAEDRFGEDKLRVLRAIRFHCKFGTGSTMDPDIEKAIPKFKHLEGVALERVRDEFLKGLVSSDVDLKRYIPIYKRTGLLDKVFPGIKFDPNTIPLDFQDKKDKTLALAWLLQANSIEEVDQMLSPSRRVGLEEKNSGWTAQEKRAVLFLLKLRDFNPNQLPSFMRAREGTGLSNQQIRDWVDMFKAKDTNRYTGPMTFKHKQIHAFADHQRSTTWQDAEQAGKDVCPQCKGHGCVMCAGMGKLPPGPHRADIIGDMEKEKFILGLNRSVYGKPMDYKPNKK